MADRRCGGPGAGGPGAGDTLSIDGLPPGPLEPGDFKGLPVLVAGLGLSGRAVATHLTAFGADVLGVDERAGVEVADLEEAGARCVVGPGKATVDLLEGRLLLVVSPGLRDTHPLVAGALEAGVAVWSEIELACRLARVPLVAVTGTNGKTTTAELAAGMLSTSGIRAVAAGNIGRPLIDVVAPLARALPLRAVVVELSSFQLRFTSRLPLRAGAWLNLAPDHLDWHGSLDAYVAAKAGIWASLGPTDWAVYAADDPLVAAEAARTRALPVPVGLTRPAAGALGIEAGIAYSRIVGHEGPLWRVAALRLPGRHNLVNALAASGLALSLGAHPTGMAGAVSAFRAPRHRLTTVAEAGGVTYVDDSKATNPHAASRALASYPRVVWIAGGRNKGLAFDELAAEAAGNLKAAVLIGEAAGKLAESLDRAGFRGVVVRAASMSEAVTLAASLADSGDTVLLAPACASQDMYRDYAERGDSFAAAVARVLDRPGKLSTGPGRSAVPTARRRPGGNALGARRPGQP